jgi:hypothetical protein
MLVRGKPLSIKQSQDRIYFNYGTDWKTDFTFFVGKRELKWFKQAGIKDVIGYYRGKELQVRGFLEPINGVMIRVTHPAQIEILN